MANEPEKYATGPEHTLEAIVDSAQGQAEHQTNEPSLVIKHRSSITKKEREASFNSTMKEVQGKMKPGSRAFSKVIHTKPVEKISDIIGSTIARPDAILSGALIAFIFTLVVYLVAKQYGYPLSGFESIGAFVLGWVIGILFDYFKVLITGKK